MSLSCRSLYNYLHFGCQRGAEILATDRTAVGCYTVRHASWDYESFLELIILYWSMFAFGSFFCSTVVSIVSFRLRAQVRSLQLHDQEDLVPYEETASGYYKKDMAMEIREGLEMGQDVAVQRSSRREIYTDTTTG